MSTDLIAEALRIADEADAKCPFFKPPYPASDNPCPTCRADSRRHNGTCVREAGYSRAIETLRKPRT